MTLEWYRRLFLLLLGVGLVMASVLLFTYEVIRIDWVSFMEIQPAHKWGENPLPIPPRSVPLEGPASIPNMGAPENPLAADEVSIARGAELYSIHCALCHGESGKGNGVLANFLQNKPSDLTGAAVQSKSDGALFLTITNGVLGRMPPLNENLTLRERWDVVNYMRTLK